MKLQILVALFLFVLSNNTDVNAQSTMITKSGTTHFYSYAPLEDIEAVNSNVTAALDFSTNEVVVKMLIKNFVFDNSLMQEHFNENYMESDQYPNAIFIGKINSENKIDPKKDGTHAVELEGEIEIHGVKKPLKTNATISIANGTLSADTKFSIMTADHKIKIPKIVIKNIAEKIDVTINLGFDTSNL